MGPLKSGSSQLPRLVGEWQGRDPCVLSSPFLPQCQGPGLPGGRGCPDVMEDVQVVMLESILTPQVCPL